MKKTFFVLTALMLVFSVNIAFARNVSVDEAKKAATTYMNIMGGCQRADISDLTLIYQIDNPELNVPACYFFNVSDWGWVIIAANTAFEPIMGYNDNGHTMDIDNAPANMMWWVRGLAGSVMDVQIEDAEYGLEENKGWAELLSDKVIYKKGITKASHYLMDEEWGQGGDAGNTFNMRCPVYEGTYTIVGCVATALSQIVHYYKFPLRGQGRHSYYWQNPELGNPRTVLGLKFDTMYFDYSLMPNIVNPNTALNKRQEVSKLCYAIGVGLDMDYGTVASGGSGAQSSSVPGVMNAYFKYQRCTQVVRANVGTVDFMRQIRSDLMLNRPVYMSGASQNHQGNDDRHAWVCCGYKDSTGVGTFKSYYMNWGWTHNSDGWYNLYDNTSMVASGYNFINEQTAMIGLIPPHPDSSEVDFWDHLSVANTPAAELYEAYPNPASYSITLPYSTQRAETLSIYDIEGRLVEQHNLEAGSGELEINVLGMPAGIYIYRVGGASGKFVVR